MREVRISLVGFGIVGHGVLEVVRRKRELLRNIDRKSTRLNSSHAS